MANTKVRIGWVPWCADVNHRRYFGSASEQQSWMASHLTTFAADDFTYQRENMTMDVPLNFEQLTGCNYVAYQNADYGSKWYYAFISSMQYKAKETTTLSLETDYLETWLFDFGWEAAFVEREIVTSDEIGEHTMNEGLDVGNQGCHDGLSRRICTNALSIQTSWRRQVRGHLFWGVFDGV